MLAGFINSALEAQEEAKREAELKDLQLRTEQLRLKGSWSEAGPYIWRLDPETGEAEYRTKPPQLQSGEILDADLSAGTMRVKGLVNPLPIPPELKEFLQNNPEMPDVHSVNWNSGMYLTKGGEVRYLTDAQMQRIKDGEQREWTLRQTATNARYDLSIKLANHQALLRQAASTKSRVSDLMGKYTDLVREGRDTPDRAADAMRSILRPIVKTEDLDAVIEEASETLEQYRSRVKFSEAEDKKMSEAMYIQRQADNLLIMLDDPAIRGLLRQHLGPGIGRLDQFRAKWLGERRVPPEVITFAATLEDLRDVIKRTRTGAAVSGTEESFYLMLLGSQASDYRTLQIRLDALIDREQARRETIWEKGLEEYYNPQEVPPEALERIPRFRRRRRQIDGGLGVGMTNEDL